MSHHPIQLINLSLSFTHKVCFDHFSATILPGQRIGIIGRNGSGKSTLLKILMRQQNPSSGTVKMPEGIVLGYVPQLTDLDQGLSGSQAFQHALTHALAQNPDVLLLDEPTNHLDQKNRQRLLRLLQGLPQTLLIVSHDVSLLNIVNLLEKIT